MHCSAYLERKAQSSIEFVAYDQNAHLGVDAERSWVQIGAADKHLVIVNDQCLGVQGQHLLADRLDHIAVAIRSDETSASWPEGFGY
jgi:hypothetical protein